MRGGRLEDPHPGRASSKLQPGVQPPAGGGRGVRRGAADLHVVGSGVGGILEVQRHLPAEPPAVQAHVLIHHAVDVLMGPQGPHQLA